MAALLVVSVLITFMVGRQVLVARDKVQLYGNNLTQLHATFATLQDAETGQRGYLLTGKENYLAPYEDAVTSIEKWLDGSQSHAAEDLMPEQSVLAIKDLVRQMLDELTGTIELARSGRREAAITTLESNSSKDLMDELRSRFSALEANLYNAQEEAHAAEAKATFYRTVTFLLVVLINLAFLAWAYRRISREVSLQYVAKLEARRQKEILAVTLSSIGDGVIITDTSGQITFINKAAEDLTGWTARQAKDQPCSSVFHIINETTREPKKSPVDKVLASEEIVSKANHTLLIRKDGTEISIDDSGAPIREADGTIRGVALIFRDFSVYAEAERNLIISKEKVEEASKAKDTFLATLSYELRTPLTPVLATLSAWEANEDLPVFLRPDLKRIRRNIELEAKLIDDLLDITRIEHGKLFLEKEVVDAHALIENVAAILQSDCDAHGVRLSITPQARESFIEADPARIQQVLWNIIGNAVKFTSAGNHIMIVTSDLGGGELEIAISDDGAGMSRETLDKIFENFHQGDPARNMRKRGLGLGLSIAKALVQAHGGTLKASSKGAGRGSCLTMVLQTAPTGATTSSASHIPSTEKLRILLVEDHEDTAQVLAQLMRGMGHAVEICSSVAQGREMIRSHEFDIILSDLGLPDGTGIDFIRSARETCQTPAVVLTGYGMAEDIKNCLQAGFDEHLTKPVDFEKLEQALRRTIRRKTPN